MKRILTRFGIFIFIGLFSVLYSCIGIVRFLHYQTGLDMAIYVQTFWFYVHGKAPFVTLFPTFGDLVWTDHFSPSLILLTPIFFLWQDPRVLLVVQAFLVCVGVYPLHRLALKYLHHSLLAYACSLTYLVSFFVQFPLTFDVHLATLGASILPWIFWTADKRKWGMCIALCMLAIGMKEDIALHIAAFGIFLAFSKRNVRLGGTLCIVGILYTVFVTKYLMPSFEHNSPKTYYVPYMEFSPQFVFNVFFNSPVKIHTMVLSFLNMLFLCAFSGWFLVVIAMHFFINFVTRDFAGRWDIYLHYRAYLGPIMYFGALLGYQCIQRIIPVFRWNKVKTLIAVLLLINAMALEYTLHLPINTIFKKQFYYEEPWIADNEMAARYIPPEVSLSTMNSLSPQTAFREVITFFPRDVREVEYVFLDTRKNQPVINYWLTAAKEEEFQKRITDLLHCRAFSIVYQRGDAVVLKRDKRISTESCPL